MRGPFCSNVSDYYLVLERESIMEEKIIPATPYVTVIMPAYNAGQYIARSIQSVIDQTFPNWVLYAIDDGSHDDTCRIIQEFSAGDDRIIFLKNEKNIGVSATRNKGIGLSRSKYIAFLDSDDVWHPEKLEKQLARIEQENADLSYCSYSLVDEHDVRIHDDYIIPAYTNYEALLKENVIGCSTVLVRTELVKQYGFRSDYYHEDYVLWLRLLELGYVAVGCTEVLVNWRHIKNSRSADKVKSAKKRWMIYRYCVGLPLPKCVRLFLRYAFAGLRKYRRRSEKDLIC